MAKKKGAGGELQEFDAKTGLYGSNSEPTANDKLKTAIGKYSDDPAKDMAEYGGLDRKPQKIVRLPKQEYAAVCSAIRTRYANKIPNEGLLLYGDWFYRFKYNHNGELILCTYRLPIDGNEETISRWTKKWTTKK